jgi:hypothetical protein
VKKYLRTSIIIGILISFPALAEQVRQMSWEDLVPAKLLADDPLANLTPDQQDLVYWVVRTLQSLPKREPETEEFYKEVDEAIPELKKAGIDIAKLMKKIKVIQTSFVEELSGQRVRIPGHLLPLEITGTKVTEFLLVPYFGACIHAPPPPPNQIIHVKIVPKEGYRIKKLYELVWVTGVISAKTMVKDLYYVDGSAEINIGYSMLADQVEPHKK